MKCLNRWNWHFGVLVFKIFPGENTPGPPYIGHTFSARTVCAPTLNSFLSLCITNFIVQIIVLSGPSKPGNTDSVSQNFKKLGKHISPDFPHFRVCPPHFLERIVALGFLPLSPPPLPPCSALTTNFHILVSRGGGWLGISLTIKF